MTRDHYTGKMILQSFAKSRGVSVDAILADTRRQPIASIRHDAYKAVRDGTKLSLPQIGRIFRRHHTTILHGIRAAERRQAVISEGMR